MVSVGPDPPDVLAGGLVEDDGVEVDVDVDSDTGGRESLAVVIQCVAECGVTGGPDRRTRSRPTVELRHEITS